MYCTILYCALLKWMLHFFLGFEYYIFACSYNQSRRSGSGGSVINWPSLSRSGSVILNYISGSGSGFGPGSQIRTILSIHNNFQYFKEFNDLLPIRQHISRATQMSRTSLLLKSQCSVNRCCNIDPVLKFKCKFSAPPGSGSGFDLSSSNDYGIHPDPNPPSW